MKKLLFLALFIVLSALEPSAQTVSRIEGGLELGATYPTADYGGIKSKGGIAVAAELRYNLPYHPIDLGVRASVSRLIRDVVLPEGVYYDSYERDDVMMVEVVGDYNFNHGGNVAYFIGGRLGYAWYDCATPEFDVDMDNQTVNAVYKSKGTGLVFSPRIGVELFRRLRLTCSYTIANKYNSHMMIGVGVVIGGGKRQTTDRITFD